MSRGAGFVWTGRGPGDTLAHSLNPDAVASPMSPIAKLFQITPLPRTTPAVEAPPVDTEQDCELLRRLARDEIEALDEVFARLWAPVVSYLIGLLGSREAAEDIAQEAFYRLWERRAQLRTDGSLRGFLYHVARNLAISEHRSENVRQRALTALQAETPAFASIELEYDGLATELRKAIGSLPQRRREILILHSIHGLSYKEIARLLGIAPQTVANQFSSALDDLRRGLRVKAMV